MAEGQHLLSVVKPLVQFHFWISVPLFLVKGSKKKEIKGLHVFTCYIWEIVENAINRGILLYHQWLKIKIKIDKLTPLTS